METYNMMQLSYQSYLNEISRTLNAHLSNTIEVNQLQAAIQEAIFTSQEKSILNLKNSIKTFYETALPQAELEALIQSIEPAITLHRSINIINDVNPTNLDDLNLTIDKLSSEVLRLNILPEPDEIKEDKKQLQTSSDTTPPLDKLKIIFSILVKISLLLSQFLTNGEAEKIPTNFNIINNYTITIYNSLQNDSTSQAPFELPPSDW